MSYILRYIQSDGTQKESEFDSGESTIDLSNRDIVQFDVSQLRSNGRITELRLDGNKLSRVDLTPLRSCKKLQTIILDDTTDGETILSDSSMEKISKDVVYDEITNFDSLSYLPSLNSIGYSLPYVKKREPKWKLIHLFQNALFVQGLGWMGLLHISIQKTERLLKELTSSGNTDKIQNVLLTLLIDQIDQGGPTIDLDV
ncbi:MAG: hypothetical protein KGD60_14990 [Candidatus Thorarchaeota archaeon]|nr:hypothetical protein [Candidatus Thorarchaeota archaeon]